MVKKQEFAAAIVMLVLLLGLSSPMVVAQDSTPGAPDDSDVQVQIGLRPDGGSDSE